MSEGTESPLDPRWETGEMKAAYAHVDAMAPRADHYDGHVPQWSGWALREAFLAGAKWQRDADAADEPATLIADRATKLWIGGKPFLCASLHLASEPQYVSLGAAGDMVVTDARYMTIDGPEPIPASGVHAIRVELPNGRVIEFQGEVDTFEGRPAFRMLGP